MLTQYQTPTQQLALIQDINTTLQNNKTLVMNTALLVKTTLDITQRKQRMRRKKAHNS